MKYLIIALLFISCSNRNKVITDLMNQKKATEDSISLFSNYESYYLAEAKKSMHSSEDSTRWNPLADSSTYYYGRGLDLKKQLKSIEFSLDSLSKMK